ncbi:FAD:protein FMN transferase [Desulfoplanes sp.]
MSTVSRRQFLYSLGVIGAGAGLTMGWLLGDCEASEQSETRVMMGTVVTISARNESRSLLEDTLEQVFADMAGAEAVFTRHDSAAPLGVLNGQGVLRDAPGPLVSLLSDSLHLAERTQGGFNPATVPVLDALAVNGVPSVGELPASVLSDLKVLTDSRGIQMKGGTIRLAHAGMGVSLDGIAKGHIVDLAAASLERHGITDFLVNAGGDIRVGRPGTSGKEWTIGIQNSADPARNIRTLPMRSGAMATSGNYESLASRGYNHLVPSDPSALSSRAAVTVTAPTCAQADSLATALFAMGRKNGTAFIDSLPGCACLWQGENSLVPSGNWPKSIC